ncbi:hypothetical protein [Candidatus Halobonum tyrrellensis]|uniref:Uncharacterized protein n=1 Tax=Candidatus Halobonum tyrrellensis G22 TaxID=1324957 RepID=V4HGB2_9EURY|nr:hypothetical protein [Candidatus Halobonum tyrrellensis]ESP86829.1 hypothetical protein K933_17137 [Candidatus Halobonum tyrrellensis G22]
MSESASLESAVEKIEETTARKRNAENIDQKVERAGMLVSTLERDVNALEDSVRKLQFYREILDSGFGIEPPGDAAISRARSSITKTSDELVSVLVEDGLDQQRTSSGKLSGGPQYDRYRDEISDAKDDVDKATDHARERYRSKREEWKEKLNSAQDLLYALGSQERDFSNTISWLRTIITNEMDDPSNSASSVVQKWQNARKKWEESEELHDTTSFQEEHGISDETMETILNLNQRTDMTLADIELSTLRELKSIPQLAESVKIEI